MTACLKRIAQIGGTFSYCWLPKGHAGNCIWGLHR